MLTNEQARAALAELRDEEGWTTQRLAALAILEAPVRELGRILLGRDREGKIHDIHPLTDVKWAFDAAAAADLDRLSDEERRSLWQILFPKLADTLDRAWRLQGRLPYQWAYLRTSFRAPRHSEITSTTRSNWILGVLNALRGYDPEVEWVAAWAAHLDPNHQDDLGILLAGAMDSGGEEGERVSRILIDSAQGAHEIGGMGRHVIRAFLVASRPEGWTFIEKTLLTAQREEGLRLSILQTINEAHPEAFRRMLRLILEHDLVRFSSTVRAIDVWFGFAWDSAAVKVVNAVIEQVLHFLDDQKARAQAIRSGAAESAYLALWTLGFEDAVAAVEAAAGLLADPDVERRFVAAHLLYRLGIAPALARLVTALDDPDLRIALKAQTAIRIDFEYTQRPPPEGAFEALGRLLLRTPATARELPPIVWPWQILLVDPRRIGVTLFMCLGARPPTALIPHFPHMDPDCRRGIALALGAQTQWNASTRETLLALAGDKSPAASKEALKALARFHPAPSEAERLERLLTRKSCDLRLGVLGLLASQDDDAALASADRLLKAAKREPRLGGLELLRVLAQTDRRVADCHARARARRDQKLDPEEQRAIDAILATDPCWRPRSPGWS